MCSWSNNCYVYSVGISNSLSSALHNIRNRVLGRSSNETNKQSGGLARNCSTHGTL